MNIHPPPPPPTKFAKFAFDLAAMQRPRPPGISAYMRIKNEALTVRACIETHLPFYDEIICVHNGCTDRTPEILAALQKQHPDKIKVLHYAPEVYWRTGDPKKEHPQFFAAGDHRNVHSLANYYNFALSKCTYSFAGKLDADHIAIPHEFAKQMRKIRRDIKSGRAAHMIYTQSAINLQLDTRGKLGVELQNVWAGNGDYSHHPVTADLTYKNLEWYESLHLDAQFRYRFMGITSFHCKHLKAGIVAVRARRPVFSKPMPFTKMRTTAFRRAQIANYKLTNNYFIKRYAPPLFGRRRFRQDHKRQKFLPGWPIVLRTALLRYWLRGINFQRDALRPLIAAGILPNGTKSL